MIRSRCRFLFLAAILLAGCETVPRGIQQAKIDMAKRIATEQPGDYFIGRRYYKPDFKFWGYVRNAFRHVNLGLLNASRHSFATGQ